MKTLNKTLAKGALGTVAAGAMALATATPAMAKDRDGGIDAGDVIAGAVVIGGIAALAGAFDKDDRRDRRYRDRHRGYDNPYGYRGGHPENAINRCVAAVEREARRAGYRYARVTQIRDVDRERRGWEVEGRIEVDGARGYGYNQGRYGYNDRYDRYDRRGYRGRGYDSGKFSCDIRRGRIVDIDFSGIRGLR